MSDDGIIKLNTAPQQPQPETPAEKPEDRAYREYMESVGEEGMQQINQALAIAASDSWQDVDGWAYLSMDRFVYRNGMQIENTEAITRKKAQGWLEVSDGQMPLEHVSKVNPTIIVLRKARRFVDEQERTMLARLHDTGSASRALGGAVPDARQLDREVQTAPASLGTALDQLPDTEPKQQTLTKEQLEALGG